VAELAVAIGRALTAKGHVLDMARIEAAAILHDMLKGQPAHEIAGAERLRSLGYPEVAAIVEVHTRLGGRTPVPEEPISEAEVVYIADKSYRRTNRVTIEARYGVWRNTWQDNPERLRSLTNGENRAKAVRERIEQALGRPLGDI
jgi:HD superfamily phosphodiesterase